MSSPKEEPRVLPKDFVPGKNQFIVGRGRKIFEHEGNKRVRNIVKGALKEYVTACSKVDKSLILLRIIRQVRHKNKELIGFVKQDLATGRWLELTEFAARVAVAQAFRDALSTRYKSSKQSKQHKRRVERFKFPKVHDKSFMMPGLNTSPLNQFPMNLGKIGGGGMNFPSTPLQDILTDACETALNNDYSNMMWPDMMNQGQNMMDGQMMMMQQQQQQQQLPMMMMMMMNQGCMMPMQKMMPQRMGNSGGMMGYSYPSTNYSDLYMDPLPFEDNAGTQEDNDFLDVFHSTPLPKLKTVLRSIKG